MAVQTTEPDDDDWLFCKRLYKKLMNIQDGSSKDYLKLNIDSQVLRMTYSQIGNVCGVQPVVQQSANSTSNGGFSNMLNSLEGSIQYNGSQYMSM